MPPGRRLYTTYEIIVVIIVVIVIIRFLNSYHW